ncbi:hypothetical protein GCM10023190_14080 [Enteractinococcus fodinae]|uniref:Uncharacterized protein n=1 Tax=Enteractinococcus fodinae TaxID=684663 RepID=A0ABU2AXP5_9MICC|nr:hypothetical protein [Enteractinococcus fodinae]
MCDVGNKMGSFLNPERLCAKEKGELFDPWGQGAVSGTECWDDLFGNQLQQ